MRSTGGSIARSFVTSLDWIFVRPAHLTDPHGTAQSYRFAPHFGRTWTELNDHISDHSPITVDLPLTEPGIDSLQSRRKL